MTEATTHRDNFWCKDLTCRTCYSADMHLKAEVVELRNKLKQANIAISGLRTIEVGDKYKTRYGDDVTILCVSAKNVRPVVGLIHELRGVDSVATWNSNGFYDRNVLSEFDLIEREKS